ncbi:MAG: CARDB domain-containing protein, partial [Candidatus Pacearchaeota archaeon]
MAKKIGRKEKTERNKLLGITLSFLFLIMLILNFAYVLAIECSDSGTNKAITYAPLDTYVGEPFNLTYSDAWTNNGQIKLYLPTELQIISGNNPANLQDDGNGGGIYSWQLNSSAVGSYNVTVEALYESCNVTRTIEIKPKPGTPNLNLTLLNISSLLTAKQSMNGVLNIKNIGNGSANEITGIIGLDTISNRITTINIPSLSVNEEQNISFSLNTDRCGSHKILANVNYKNDGNNFNSFASKDFNVIGSNLMIISFTFSPSSVEEGRNVQFNIAVKNIGNLNATNAIVRIYRGNRIIASSNIGSIGVDEVKTITINWRASDAGTFTPIAVVDSDQECANWPNDFVGGTLRVVSAEEEEEEEGKGGGGGGAAPPAYVCGNKICESWLGENSSNCA